MSDDDSFYSCHSSSTSVSSLDNSLSVNNFLSSQCQRFNQLFNVCHVNAQSIPQHHSEMLDLFCDVTLHAILVSESWLKPELSSTFYSLPGFVLIRNDRTGKRAGGVAIYLRSDIPYKILSSSPPVYNGNPEYLILEIAVKGVKAVLGVVYCPPAIDYFSSLESLFESVSSEYKHHIVMGDFNTDLLKDNPRSRRLRAILESSSLSLLALSPTHHNSESNDSWLDLMLTSSVDLVANHGQVAAPGLSRHDLIYLSYKIKPPKQRPAIVFMRNFARLDTEKLNADAQALDWDNLVQSSTVDEKVETFNRSVLQLIDAHAPLRAVRVKRPPAPWITPGVRMAMRRRDRAFRRYRRDRSEETWNLYKLARNRCNQMVRASKRRYICENVLNSSPADIWKFLKSLGITKSPSSILPSSLSLNVLNKHFSTSATLSVDVRNKTIHDITSKPMLPPDSFSFSPVTNLEVLNFFTSIKSRAVGCDGISRTMLSFMTDNIIPIVTHIINFSLFTGEFPALWRKAYIIPLPKISSPSLPNHYRPISILPFLSKILEAAALSQISSYVFKNNLLSKFQSGFRPGHSTATALLKVTEDVRDGLENSKVTVLVLIDFSNAFNTVDHDILLAILSQIGVSSLSRDWFSSYLRGRQQAVRADRDYSDWCDLVTGVPQGGILSPLLFSLFINSITTILKCSYHLYADDLQLYAQSDVASLDNCISILNADLKTIGEWSGKFGVAVNVGKCQAILIGSSYYLRNLDTSQLMPLMFDNSVISLSPHVKDLGLYIDDTLSWNKQVAQVSQKVTYSLRSLYRFKHFLPSSTKITLVQSLVLPIIDYADVCYSDLSQELLNKLDRLLNNCIRFIFGLRKYDHISSYRSQLKWLPIRLRRSLRCLCMLFTILTDPRAPDYLKSYFKVLGSSHTRNLRASNNLLLEIPSHRTGFMSTSYAVSTIKLWNALPLGIKKAESKMAFKRTVRKFYLR